MTADLQNSTDNKTLRILIVESPAKDVQAIQKILSEETQPVFAVEAISNRKVALERALKGGIDLAFLDASILSSQSFEYLEQWVQKVFAVPVVILSDTENKKLFSEAIRKGAQDYLTKSEINAKLLLRVIRYAIDRKQNELKLKSLANMGLDFVFLVSHELRAPLAITKEGVNLVLDKILGKTNQKQQQVLKTARKNIDRLDQIIMNMLDISRIEAGRITLKKQWFDLADLVKQVAGSFEARIKEKNLEFRVSSSSNKIEVYADQSRIFQVLINLVGNAVKFTKEGLIEISINEKENSIECAVSDTGVGVAKVDLPKVFGKFQQLGWAPGGGEKGMGLGLAITKAIMELHNGSITAESQANKGSRFVFSLPKERSAKSRKK